MKGLKKKTSTKFSMLFMLIRLTYSIKHISFTSKYYILIYLDILHANYVIYLKNKKYGM